MKNGFKICLILLVAFCIPCSGQLVFRGVSIQGITTSDLAPFRSLGLVAAYDASTGVYTNSSGRITMWTDLTGNGFNLVNTLGTGPVWTNTYTTNAFPAVVFSGTRPLWCHPLSAFATGKQPITVLVLGAGQVASSSACVTFGNTNAANLQASYINLRFSSSPPTTKGLYAAWDTNVVGATDASFSLSSGTSTNIYCYTGFTFSNNVGRSFNNVNTPNNSTVVGGTITLTTFSVGARIHTNSVAVSGWSGGLTRILIFTNVLSATQMTNSVIKPLNQLRTVF